MKTDNLPAPVTELVLALTLLTRLPMPRLPVPAFDKSARAVWAYPLAGLITGALAAAAGIILSHVGLPATFAAGGVLLVMMATTCALHEDGLADVADGFWGGTDPARRLEIMKDSQIGSYGTLALIIVTGLRWSAYGVLIPLGAAPVVAAAVLSRAMMPLLMTSMPHARESGLSHSVGRPSSERSLAGLALGLVLTGLLLGAPAVAALLAALCTTGFLGWVAHRKIGGQTGDVLGAGQQLSELAILASLILTLT